jgi:hypothetical protein
MVSTTHVKRHLWHYQDCLDHHVLLCVADDNTHTPVGMGYLKIPVQGPLGSIMFPCYYTPTMPATIISPDAIGRSLGYRGYQSFSNFDGQHCGLRLLHCTDPHQDTIVPLTLVRGLLYTDQIVFPATTTNHSLPCSAPTSLDDQPGGYTPPYFHPVLQLDVDLHRLSKSCDGLPQFTTPLSSPHHTPATSSRVPTTYHICHLGRDQLCLLWHQRLGHLNFRRTSDLHRTADGVPKIPTAHDLDN